MCVSRKTSLPWIKRKSVCSGQRLFVKICQPRRLHCGAGTKKTVEHARAVPGQRPPPGSRRGARRGGAMEPAILTVETGLAAETGPASVLARKISASSVLSPGERAMLRSFEANPRPLRRRQEFITEGRKYQNLFVILDGVSIRYRVLRNGTRQVIGIMLP